MDDNVIRKRKIRNETAKKLEKKLKLEYSRIILDEISQEPKLFYELLDEFRCLSRIYLIVYQERKREILVFMIRRWLVLKKRN